LVTPARYLATMLPAIPAVNHSSTKMNCIMCCPRITASYYPTGPDSTGHCRCPIGLHSARHHHGCIRETLRIAQPPSGARNGAR
jgi:hypothetical protein